MTRTRLKVIIKSDHDFVAYYETGNVTFWQVHSQSPVTVRWQLDGLYPTFSSVRYAV